VALPIHCGTSRETSALARRAVDEGADLLFILGGDGTVQRCVDAVARADVTHAILPANTDSSPRTEMTQGRKVDIKLSQPTRYELDGGARRGKKRLRAREEPGAIVARVPAPDQ
jgi:diacylglycerol kinase (ATP)